MIRKVKEYVFNDIDQHIYKFIDCAKLNNNRLRADDERVGTRI